MKRFSYLLLSLLLILCTGCDKTNTSTVDKSSAQLTKFYFAAVDSMPGLAKASFTIEERNDTGLVWNKDSMLYGTDLHHVVPRFSFKSTPDAAYLRLGDTLYVLTGSDTLDFTRRPAYLSIRSADKTNTKIYEIRATVHTSDPDLYTWEQINSGIYAQDDSEQRVVEIGADFVMIASNGFAYHAYRSPDGVQWTELGTPSGLPAGTKVRQIVSDGTTLYYGQDSTLYTSSDAITWTGTHVSYPIAAMLLYWNERIWALVDNNGYELAYVENANLTLSNLRPEGEFPISDFATVCFQSSSLRERAMIIGGFAENGKSLNTRWNLEYTRHPLPNGTYRLQEFSIDRTSFYGLTGVSVVYYNHQLLLFGGVNDKMSYFGRDIHVSSDEGLTWTQADTTKNQLPDVYQARQKQTAIVRDGYIYLFGGQDIQTTYSDVYRGRLNSIDW